MALLDKIKVIPRRLICDERGWFLKVIDGKEQELPNHVGEVYITYAKPLQSKGSHYHPMCNEWFTIVEGAAELRLKDVATNEAITLQLSANEPQTVFVPCGVAHIFENKSANEDFMLIAYADTLYDPLDTIPLEL